MGPHILGADASQISNLHRVRQTYVVHIYVSFVVFYYCHFERTTCLRCVTENECMPILFQEKP